ncbi:uncharacterized protein PG998_004923 [Apiospora kogelbergensis]|uniref:uncharacterized protein n=1 Tax=Apiospora kogelbergensis TaxID=1337665 RepID=UPI0031317E12
MRAKNLLGEGSSVMPVAELRVAWIWPICPTIPEEPEASKILEGQLPLPAPLPAAWPGTGRGLPTLSCSRVSLWLAKPTFDRTPMNSGDTPLAARFPLQADRDCKTASFPVWLLLPDAVLLVDLLVFSSSQQVPETGVGSWGMPGAEWWRAARQLPVDHAVKPVCLPPSGNLVHPHTSFCACGYGSCHCMIPVWVKSRNRRPMLPTPALCRYISSSDQGAVCRVDQPAPPIRPAPPTQQLCPEPPPAGHFHPGPFDSEWLH